MIVEGFSGDSRNIRPQFEGSGRAGTPQIEVPVLQAEFFADIDVTVNRERQWRRSVQYQDLLGN
jgi:hypothetical protein